MRLRCALCLQEATLRNSHVIPEFLYESMYDEIHRFHVLSAIPDKKNSMEQKGLREKLLCDKCEQQISRYEGYAKKVLKGGIALEFQTKGNFIEVSGLNYQLFKLFELSILWRAGVSSLPFFEDVTLGPHEEILRKMLLEENPGEVRDYGCLMFGLKDKSVVADLMVQPERIRFDGINSYRFVFGGFHWQYIISSHNSAKYSPAFIQPSGSQIFLVKNIFEAGYIKSFGMRLAELGRLPNPDPE